MKICIIADENKAELTAGLCAEYCGALCLHRVFATGSAAGCISNSAGFRAEPLLAAQSGGTEQVTQMVACREAGMVLCLRDANPMRTDSPEFSRLVRCCDFYGVPVATGLSTARILLQSLGRKNNADFFKKLGKNTKQS